MVYLLGWGLALSSAAIEAVTRYRGRFFVLVVVCYFAFIAIFRGMVGTDTANYERMLGEFSAGIKWSGGEVGFVLVGSVLAEFLSSAYAAVRGLAFIFFGLLGAYVIRSVRDERFFVVAYFLPAFAYQYSMNALRIGLATGVLLLVIQSVRKRNSLNPLKWGLLATFFHYSSAFSIAYYFLSCQSWSGRQFLWRSIGLLGFILVVFILAESYFLNKLTAYQLMKAPSSISGLSKIIPLSLILLFFSFDRVLPVSDALKLFSLAIVCMGIAWIISGYSYSGLRIIDLLAFIVPVSFLSAYARHGLQLGVTAKIGMLSAGFLMAAGVYRGFVLSEGVGASPFLPYEWCCW